MRRKLVICIALLAWWTLSIKGSETGGVTARFSPSVAKPGDLVTLSIEMIRDSFGEFELDIPPHPQLHLIARERVPPTLQESKYLQGERLQLQALSSGTIKLTNISIQLTEIEGTRKIQLPAPVLTVEPFDHTDVSGSPEPLPQPGNEPANGKAVILSLLFVVLGGVILFLLIVLKFSLQKSAHNTETETDPWSTLLRAASLSDESLERFYHYRKKDLSSSLKEDLEAFLYTERLEENTRERLHHRLREELLR
ncbi:MAG: hypothetical protein AAGA96_01090 [Verrucomicrobiota bacterium]